ncbi:MAG: CheW-like domain [Myxococcales bacterium]|nr:CheW-like domain [Myxococcales bacterium]
MSDVLVVDVGDRRVAVPVAHVRAISAAGFVTPVPTAPLPVVGVTQLRGQILPVLDVGQPPRIVQPQDPLLVLEYGPARAALVFTRLCPPDEAAASDGAPAEPPLERLDVGALFDLVRARAGAP